MIIKEQEQMLEVVDEEDNVIGLESREKIHKEELLHRDVHIWFVTPKSEIIFQRRTKYKDSFPGLLDATAAGHVEPGMTYEETVSKECLEETGIHIDISKLLFLKKFKNESYDAKNKNFHRTLDRQYAYLFEGNKDDLRVEELNAEGFELWSLAALRNLSDEDRARFIPARISEGMLNMFSHAIDAFLQ
jgi:isopentenyldiphosphate isomerase